MWPPTARYPTSPDPGFTSRPSSVNTFVSGPTLNLAVSPFESVDVIAFAKPTPSLEPSES